MSPQRTNRGKRHSDNGLEVRFKELAVLQRALLDQHSEIELLRAQKRRTALASSPVVSNCSAESDLAAARDQIVELERIQLDLVSAVNEKERQRFALAIKLQDALILMEETQISKVPSEGTARLGETLRMQEELLQEKEGIIVELQDALVRAQEERTVPASSEDLAQLGKMLRVQEVQLREYEETIAKLNAATQPPPATVLSLSHDPNLNSVLYAIMLEYHSTTTAALAERDHAILTMTTGSSTGTKHARRV